MIAAELKVSHNHRDLSTSESLDPPASYDCQLFHIPELDQISLAEAGLWGVGRCAIAAGDSRFTIDLLAEFQPLLFGGFELLRDGGDFVMESHCLGRIRRG